MRAENKSVLTGYAIKHNLEGLIFGEVWEDLIESGIEGVSCSEVLHFDLPPKELAKLLRKGELRDVLGEMRFAGANFIFVGPVVGKPIDGLSL
jgi:hypothetical protein